MVAVATWRRFLFLGGGIVIDIIRDDKLIISPKMLLSLLSEREASKHSSEQIAGGHANL